MCLGGSGGGAPDYTAQNRLAVISQAIYDDYVQRYQPIERELAAEALTPYSTSEGAQAGEEAGAASDVAGAGFYRGAARSGITLSSDQRSQAGRTLSRQRALNVVGARNTTRRAFHERRQATLGGLASSGRRLQSGAVDKFGQVSSLATSRNNINAQNAAASANQKASTIGTIIGIGAGALLCWVARAVYGAESMEWRLFRRWLLTRAPESFLDWYLKNGERYAREVENDEALRAELEGFMNQVIENYAIV